MEAFDAFQLEKHSLAQFESGTLDSSMQDMVAKNGSLVGIFDEFSTFKDSLNKGSSGAAEKRNTSLIILCIIPDKKYYWIFCMP